MIIAGAVIIFIVLGFGFLSVRFAGWASAYAEALSKELQQ